ncbi:unnamed protein product [Echinostoma caproni]|uniref:RalBP1-associated Eps domain-containing protein 2 n=1 Tax=Echinostoma caproni TaxID=27848 RepID=A0A183BAU8_9TREM|nr:unnamed protein product [Echinostoma caproni]
MITSAELWKISSEQRAYYLSQFIRLQSDPRAKLSGSQAKMFFELSKLPTTELSDIWELSDVDRDGQLTLGEFAVAMHLVVLRRNGVPVPCTLPHALMEVITNQSLSTLMCTGAVPVDKTDAHHEFDATHIIPPDTTGGPAVNASVNSAFPIPGNRPWPGSPTCSSVAVTPVSARQRRWSISSQSDISSLAEGIIHFEAKPNADGHVSYVAFTEEE